MKLAQAWIIQAYSDLVAAGKLLDEHDSSTYCQAISKYQQSVEKSVKAIVAALYDLRVPGVTLTDMTGKHTLDHEMRVLDAVQRKKRDIDTASVNRISTVLTRRQQERTKALCGFAPKLPAPGQPFALNTEYPYHLDPTHDDWTAPAVPGAFSLEVVKDAQQLAWPLYHKTKNIVDLLRRNKR